MRKENIIVFNNIKLPINASVQEAFSVARKKYVGLIGAAKDAFFVFRRSIDARKKDNILFVYSIGAEAPRGKISEIKLAKFDATIMKVEEPIIDFGTKALSAPPVIVGSGPCGLFCALLLAEYGYSPILLERGGSISERKRAVEAFYENHTLNLNSNIQFGAGGAGTFSDGKLVTRINDPLCNYVLSRFVEFGAPSEI